MTTTTTRRPPLQLVLRLVALPGPDWATEEPYASEAGKTCPARYIDTAGRVWRYVGGLVDGAPRYELEATQ